MKQYIRLTLIFGVIVILLGFFRYCVNLIQSGTLPEGTDLLIAGAIGMAITEFKNAISKLLAWGDKNDDESGG